MIKVGQTILQESVAEIEGSFVALDKETFYKIGHYDKMRAFFISLVSHSDQWLFISSKGGLTAGRKNPENALFPYYTDDKIHDSNELTGSKTIILIDKSESTYLWEPFSDRFEGAYKIERNLYKNTYGNQLIFEEINHDLGVSFSYRWAFSQTYGLVKKSCLINHGTANVKVRLIDGIQNILPYGINLMMQSERSTLLDAYKKNELLEDSNLGLFLLSSVPVDKAEPSEALKATTVWQTGLTVNKHLLSANQLNDFRKGKALEAETDIRAERGAYLVESSFELTSKAEKTWYFTAELNQGPAKVFSLHDWIKKDTELVETLEKDIDAGTKELINIVAASDGLQQSSDKILTTRHFANVLFNVMRGGIFDHHYDVPRQDLVEFLEQSNPIVAARNTVFLQSLATTVQYTDLIKLSAKSGDTDLQRLCLEYLPLTFSRRHGDPSRPWNRFSIELEDDLGAKKFFYQGNWRDIFQNWEALAFSYPRFIESMITKFVNASTVDGYNPYRITRDGIDWELVDEEDPWSFIGYWGDHQIIYLLKLMELSQAHQPKELNKMLLQKIYVYANVPYKIKDYDELLATPSDTILFDNDTQEMVEERIKTLGADGKLVQDEDGVYYVNLSEKILVSLLAKLSNYIPEGGIWLNTQRPEWNDANNALVGNGVSMVTLYYIRRFVTFSQSLFAGLAVENVEISEEVAELLEAIAATFEGYHANLHLPRTNHLRRQILDELGVAGTIYRNRVYKGFCKKSTSVSLKSLDKFFTNVLACTDHTIAANQRADKLYHSYNLMQVDKDGGIDIRYLYEMLEGQVAVLSTGILNSNQTIEVLQALKNSSLYRADQHSYILYPDRQLPRFEAKNSIPATAIEQSTLLQKMVDKGDRRLIEKDVVGGYHFNGNFHNKTDVIDTLKKIGTQEYGDLTITEHDTILDIFEGVFDHQSFTGRSGTFFGYEGLGCIYWHMVSKLILAVEEKCLYAIENNLDATVTEQLIEHYYDVREGLGFNKTPDVYGAFPTDPYSHTPGNAGAQQPGMTGQVKEDIITRFRELGVWIKAGEIVFNPRLLRQSEFLTTASNFTYIDLQGDEKTIDLSVDSLAFTYCQIPVLYTLGTESKVTLTLQDGQKVEMTEMKIDKNWCTQLFERTGQVACISVSYDRETVRFVAG